MKRAGIVIGLMVMFALAGCAPPAPGTPVTFDTACDAANDGKRVALEGYPQLPSMMMVSDDFRSDFYEKPGAQGKSIGVYFTIGSGPNKAEDIPDDFKDGDLKIHTSDDQVVTVDSHIRVHGKLSVAGEGDSFTCFISQVDLIEEVQ